MRLSAVRSSRVYLAGAVAASALAAFMIFAYLRSVSSRAAAVGELVKLVVAERDLSAGEVLDSSSLTLVPFPERCLLAGCHTDTSSLIGQTLSRPLRRGEPVLDSALVSSSAGGEVAAALDPGFRAFPLSANSVAFPPEKLAPGCRVDVIIVEGSTARLAVENVEVLETTSLPPESGALAGSTWSAGGCFLLEITPEEACLLAAAIEGGRVEILLRPLREP